MIDHTGIVVTDYVKSKAFYSEALAPIGYLLLAEIPASVTGHVDVAGFGEAPKPDFWISHGSANKPPVHVALGVSEFLCVRRFQKLAVG